MKKVLIILFVIFLLICCCCLGFLLLLSNSRKTTTNTSTSCPTNYIPVCAVDGKTYKNDCEARLNGTTTDHFGVCSGDTTNPPATLPNGKFCTEIFNPVCGEDGVSYENACIADLYNTKVASQGLCVGKPINMNIPTIQTPSFNLNNIFGDIWTTIWKSFTGAK
ncbi:MAG: Kazal-type serine protease inhibitor domain-containing protein [Candidatus Dojkabacteria bacterium]